MTPLTLFIAFLPMVQEAPQDPEKEPKGVAETATGLSKRLREMRRSLVLGGAGVRAAEAEARDFYRKKVEQIDRRSDSNGAELAEKQAEYAVALDQLLSASAANGREEKAVTASRLREKLTELKDEAATLRRWRGQYSEAIGSIRARERRREQVATQLDAGPGEAMFTFPLPAIGLAPDNLTTDARSALSSPELIEDLVARDPDRARRMIFSLDPAEYWRRWPLQPPEGVLRQVLVFPAPDLPNHR